MAAKLVAEEGLLRELVLSLEEGDHWVIGRDPDACQLLIEDPSASRKHALCRRTADGIVIENLSSTNPVLVNDEIITQPRLLNNEDTVKIGDSIFRFYSEPGARLMEEESPTTTVTESVSQEKLVKDTPESSVEEIAAKNGEPHETSPVEEAPMPEHELEEDEEVHDTIFGDDHQDTGIAKIHFDLTDSGRWLLKVVGGPNNGAEFSMQANNSYLLGTDPNTCDIVFHDNSVSRQHARVSVAQDDTLSIEDLKSRNGTRVDGDAIEGKHALSPQSFVTMGTSSFVVYDREGEMQTIISPLLPSIVKVLQHDEEAPKPVEKPIEATIAAAPAPEPAPVVPPKPKSTHAIGTFMAIGILMGLFTIIGLGVSTLFLQEPVQLQQVVDTDQLLSTAMQNFPQVKYYYNKSTGRLLLVGHVLTSSDKSQMLYNLQGLRFVKDIDDSGVIIDEFVWGEANQVLSKNGSWKGVTVHSPTPGKFVLSGYLSTRDQAAQVWDYITRNFNYVDLLENHIIVEEDVLNTVNSILYNKGLTAVTSEMSNGELTLAGHIATGKQPDLDAAIVKIQEIQGIRVVKNYVTEVARDEAVINISNKYHVTGSSRADGGNLTVIINGRILSEGDILDNMKITNVTPSTIFLEKDTVRYRIDY